MDAATMVSLQRKIVKEIESGVGRKLTDLEYQIAYESARKGIFAGKKYESGDLFVEKFNNANYR